MSNKAMSWALDHAPSYLTSGERFVLVALADFVGDDTRDAYPSVATLARRTGLTRRSVQRALSVLHQAYIIRIAYQQKPRGGREDRRTNLYYWQPEKAMRHRPGGDVQRLNGQVEVVALAADEPAPVPLPELTAAAIREVTESQQTGCQHVAPLDPVDNPDPGAPPCRPVEPNGVTPTTPRGDTTTPEPRTEPPYNTWSPSSSTVEPRAGAGVLVPEGVVDPVTGVVHPYPGTRPYFPRPDRPSVSAEEREQTYRDGAAEARLSLLAAVSKRTEDAI